MFVFPITKRDLIADFTVDDGTPLEHRPQFDSVADLLDYLESD